MTAQHDWRLLRRAHSHHLELPSPISKSIGNITDHLPRKPLVAILVRQTEGDTVACMSHHSPIPPIPPVRPTMQCIQAIRIIWGRVLVGQDLERLAINRERGILDAIGVSPWNASEMRMLLVNTVVRGVVEATDDIALDSGGVIDEEVGDGGAVGDKCCADVGTFNCVFAIGVGSGGIASDSGVSCSSGQGLTWNLSKHC